MLLSMTKFQKISTRALSEDACKKMISLLMMASPVIWTMAWRIGWRKINRMNQKKNMIKSGRRVCLFQ
jgi:hypothetical protein